MNTDSDAQTMITILNTIDPSTLPVITPVSHDNKKTAFVSEEFLVSVIRGTKGAAVTEKPVGGWSGGTLVLDIRDNGPFKNRGFFLSHLFDWAIGYDSDARNMVLIPLKKA